MQLVANELCHLNCIISFRYYGPWLVLCIVMVTFLMAISCVIHYRVSLFLLPTGFANHAYKYLIWCFVLIIVEETKQRKCRVCWTKYGCSKGTVNTQLYAYLVHLYTKYLNWQNLWRDEIKPLMPYPWIYIATFVFPVINRCVNNYHISEDYVVVWVKVHV